MTNLQYLLAFYWIVCGFTVWSLPEANQPSVLPGFFKFFLCFLVGGFVVPTRILNGWIK